MPSLYICRICKSQNVDKTFLAKEMMFGTREAFEYFQCNNCKCLQISKIPSNLSSFYPENYYSYRNNSLKLQKKSPILKQLEMFRIRYALFGKGFKLAKLSSHIVDLPSEIRKVGPWLKKCNISSFDAEFLDIGCGTESWWLNNLKSLGFHKLLGIDPFIQNNVTYNGITILKTHPHNLHKKFDLISLHHSLEHIPNQVEILRNIRSLLKPNGFCLIRIPLVSSLVWEQYGTDWVELDAPRHLYLHSYDSLKLLADNEGFHLADFFCDSTEFEFWGSEQYRRDIPLMAEDSFSINSSKSNFTYREMSDFKNMAEEANNIGQGGRGCFFFRLK